MNGRILEKMAQNCFWILFLLVCLVFTVKRCSCSHTCIVGEIYGAYYLETVNDTVGSNTSMGVVCLDSDFMIFCCGVTTQWDVKVAGVTTPTTIYFQIWFVPSGGTDVYWLVGQNNLTVSSDGLHTLVVPVNEQISVRDGGYYIGWWTDGADVIVYDDGPYEAFYNHELIHGAVAVAASLDWSTSTEVNGRTYAVRAILGPSNYPNFTNLPTTVDISNTVPIGMSLFTVSYTDPDPGDVASLTVTMTSNARFSFDPITGEVFTAALFLMSEYIYLGFTVSSACSQTWYEYLTVNVTNEPPVIHNLPAFTSIHEDITLQTLLFQIEANDSVSDVTCYLYTPDPFTVQLIPGLPSTYGIYTYNYPYFDYDVISVYYLNIDCTDGESVDTELFTVYLIPNLPATIENLPATVYLSITSPIGFPVYTVLADDPENDTLSYWMSCDQGYCPFDIFATGEVYVSDDLTWNSEVGYDVSIFVYDARNTIGPSIITVIFNDTNTPVTITNLPQTLAVQENTPLGGWSFQVIILDPNVDQSHNFTLYEPSSGINYFKINNDGLITTAGTVLDYETLKMTSFMFSVTVADPYTTYMDMIYIDIIDVNEPPSFGENMYLISTSENIAGTIIGTPNYDVTDPDMTFMWTFSLVCGAIPGYIDIDPVSGQLMLLADYDRDTGTLPTSVACDVRVTDDGGLKDTSELIITIININDNVPAFYPTTYTFYVMHNAAVGTFVGKVTATDADAGVYGVLTYSLNQVALTAPILAIDNNGVIKVAISPESVPLVIGMSANVVVTAKDVDQQSDVANVMIIVADPATAASPGQYRTFASDARNAVWLVLIEVVGVVILGAIAYVFFTRPSAPVKLPLDAESADVKVPATKTEPIKTTKSSREVFQKSLSKEKKPWQ